MLMTLHAHASPLLSSPGSSPLNESPSFEELEEVDRYLAASDWETAREVLDLLTEMYPGAPEIQARYEQLAQAQTERTASDASADLLADLLGEEELSERDDDLLEFLDDLPSLLDEDPPSATVEEDIEQLGFESHYNRALVYRDMELHHKVIGEIEKALRAELPPASTNLCQFQCYYLLGQAHSQCGNFQQAIHSFMRGLSIPGRTEEEYQAVRYDLGLAYEKNQEIEKALEIFSDIFANDITYRDVRDRIKSMQVAWFTDRLVRKS